MSLRWQNQSWRTIEIFGRAAQRVRIVTKQTKASIAFIAQQPANLPSGVTVIHRKIPPDTSVGTSRVLTAANGTLARLLFQHEQIVIVGESVTVQSRSAARHMSLFWIRCTPSPRKKDGPTPARTVLLFAPAVSAFKRCATWTYARGIVWLRFVAQVPVMGTLIPFRLQYRARPRTPALIRRFSECLSTGTH